MKIAKRWVKGFRLNLPESIVTQVTAICVAIDRFLWDTVAPVCYLPFDGTHGVQHLGIGTSAGSSIDLE